LSASKAASFDKLHSRFEGRVIKKLVRRDSPVKLFFNRHLTNKPTVVPTALTNTFTGQKSVDSTVLSKLKVKIIMHRTNCWKYYKVRSKYIYKKAKNGHVKKRDQCEGTFLSTVEVLSVSSGLQSEISVSDNSESSCSRRGLVAWLECLRPILGVIWRMLLLS
jgi:hypothetical protein